MPRPDLWGGTATRPASAQGRLTRQVIAGVLVLVILVAPVPVGSNRPVFWLAWAALLALMLGVQALAMAWRRDAALRATGFRAEFVMFALLLAALVLQALPFGLTLPLPSGAPLSTISLAPAAVPAALIRWLGYGALFALMVEVAANRARARRMAHILFFGICAHALFGLVALNMLGDFAPWGEKTAHLGAATGVFANRNSFATFLGFGLALGAALVLRPARAGVPALGRGFMILGLGVIGLALLATQSRMGLVSGMAGVAVVIWLSVPRPIAPARWMGLAAIAIALIVTAAYVGQDTLGRMVFAAQALDTRLALYQQVIGMILARPWTGYGIDAFAPAYELFHQPPVSADLAWDHAHSSYLHLWAELGLIAGSLPVLMGVAPVLRLRAHLRDQGQDRALPIAALAALWVGAIHSLVDFSLEIPANAMMLIALVALGLAGPPPRPAAKITGNLRQWALEVMQPMVEIGFERVHSVPGGRGDDGQMMEDSVDLKAIASLLRRHFRLILGACALSLGIGAVGLASVAPIYSATALILLDPSSKNLLAPDGADTSSVGVENARVDSEVEVLRSDAVTMAVVRAEGLLRDPEFGIRIELGERMRRALGLVASADQTPDQMLNAVLARFGDAVSVRRRGLTYVVAVSVRSKDASRAAHLANAVATAYITQQVDAKVAATLAARDVLQARIVGAREAIARSDQGLEGFIDANLGADRA